MAQASPPNIASRIVDTDVVSTLKTKRARSSGTVDSAKGVDEYSEDALVDMDDKSAKRERRKQSNRESARRSRLRKQAECEQLQRENAKLLEEVRNLKNESIELRAEISVLKAKLEVANKSQQ